LKVHKLVLLRHGESQWNLENRFTGWTDVGLTEKGVKEAKLAAKLLIKEGLAFDLVYTSVLKRSIRTMEICLQEMGIGNIPKISDWRLNERHYGSLQGLNKSETAKKYGDDKVLIWRRSFDAAPPSLYPEDKRHPKFDELYKKNDPIQLPNSESLKDTINRFMPLWNKNIKVEILSGKKVLIVAHGNSLRSLVKYLDKMSSKEIINFNIPTGVPLVFDLNEQLDPINKYYLGNKKEISKKIANVTTQGKSNYKTH
jgi:2,3-bisphosphoglycerate-dependent phosphoglycerate mutase